MPLFRLLEERGVLKLSGEDRIAFLHGLISSDVRRVAPDRAIYGALLTPQGKYLHDFFVSSDGESLFLDCEAGRRDDLMRRLKLFRLRAKVEIEDVTGRMVVAAAFGEGTAEALGLNGTEGAARPMEPAGIAYVDPRLSAMGARLILPAGEADGILTAAGFVAAGPEDYEALRLRHIVPDGSRDLVLEKSTLMESNFDELNGISWDKGCYVGQELTARTKYRGLVKKRLVGIEADGPVPAPGTPILLDGKEVGEVRSGLGNRGIALIRLAAMDAQGLTAGDVALRAEKPAYAAF